MNEPSSAPPTEPVAPGAANEDSAMADDVIHVDDPAAADGPAPATSDADVEVQCPGCGLMVVGQSPRATAAWFCPRCDYPLFWASEPPPGAPPSSRAARRRLPGTGGRQIIGAAPCWHCGEMSEPGDTECGRCAATLPKPRAPRVKVPEPYPVPVPVAVRTTVWPFIAAGTLGGAAVATVLTLWASGVI